jgi:hypothetical protein
MIKTKLLIIFILLCSACHQSNKPNKGQVSKLDTSSTTGIQTKKTTIKVDSTF